MPRTNSHIFRVVTSGSRLRQPERHDQVKVSWSY